MVELTPGRSGTTRSVPEGAGNTDGAAGERATVLGGDGVDRPRDVEVDILGPVVWRVAGTTVSLAPKLRSLIALLALQSGHAVSVTEIATTLWGDDCLSNARKSIQVLVYRLRLRMNATLEAAGRPPVGDEVITTAGDTYTLRLDADAVDARRFERLVVQSRATLECRPAEADRLLDMALGLWRGDALTDLGDSDTGQAERTRLEELRRGAEEDLVQCRLALGRHAELSAILEAGVAAHPLRERRWGQLMVALYRSGRQADALRAFQRARATLVDELGIEPGEDLRRLESAIIAQDPMLELVAWRAPVGAGAAPTTGPRASNIGWALRQQAVPLVGRRDEVAWLRSGWQQVSDDATAAVVLLSGDAGIGKTRLAAEIAVEADRRGAMVLAGCCSCDVEGSGWCEALEYFARNASEGDRAALHDLGPDIDALTHLAPRLADDLGAVIPMNHPGSRKLAAALTSFLGALASRQPVLVVIDDLHLGGQLTLRVLSRLVRGLAGHPVMVVGTYRDGCGVPDEAFDDLLEVGAALRHVPHHGHLVVGGLSRDDAVSLVAGMGGPDRESAALAREAGGNPLYLIELARAAGGRRAEQVSAVPVRVPVAIRTLVDQRLRHLGSSVADLLSMASVIGASFSLAMISELSGMTEDRALDLLDRAVGAGLVGEVDDAGYAFVNGVDRRVLADRLTAGRRSWLERRLAGATVPTGPLLCRPPTGQLSFAGGAGPSAETPVDAVGGPADAAVGRPGERRADRPPLVPLVTSAEGW